MSGRCNFFAVSKVLDADLVLEEIVVHDVITDTTIDKDGSVANEALDLAEVFETLGRNRRRHRHRGEVFTPKPLQRRKSGMLLKLLD